MPTSMTFALLQADVRAYLERGTVSDETVFDQLPRLINLAEREIARELKIQGFINVVTNTMAVGTSIYQKPDRWRDTVSMNFGAGVGNNTRTPLFPRSYEYCRMYWPDEDLTDEPKFYSGYNYFNWLFVPTPDFAYPFEVSYYELPALLDDVNTTNWLTDFAPEVLLSGALLQTSLFLKEEKQIALWGGKHGKNISLLGGEDLQKIIDRTSTREGA